MAGKRLLDAAKLFTAGRSVASQHFTIRKQQWDLFTRTSSLAKAVKSQTDRVTVTIGAAVELAKRFNENGPRWQDEAEDVRRKAAETAQKAGDEVQNIAKDVETQARNAGYENVASTISQARGQSADDGTLASLRKQEQQKQAERHLPEHVPDSQPRQYTAGGQDTFNERSTRRAEAPNSRTELHLHSESPTAAQSDLHDKLLNSDVFPEPADQPPEGVNLDAFHSPRVSRMLGKAGPNLKSPYTRREKAPPKPLPEMVQAEEARRKASQEPASTRPEAVEQKPSSTHERVETSSASSPAPETSTGDAETQDLAASIANQAAAKPEAESYEMHESRVPATRFGRFMQYGGLATSMAFGAVGESFRRIAGGGATGSLMLSEGNMNRLVAKLSRMRGAALKLGQMMSFQDSKVLPPAINTILQRVQDSADYMPASQRDKVLIRNLGQNWRDLFSDFSERPFAAASIGQVHKATLASNGKPVAVKIQYPGVRNSIDSDLNNLSLLLTASQLLPRGLFLDKTIANARTELGWECDYEREAQACTRFKDQLLLDETDTFLAPQIYPEASGMDVLTAEFMHGTAVTKIKDLTQSERDWIGTNILRLCLRELMEWKFMQTDPNWTNFLYNRSTKKLELLDFGASREFPDEFVIPYVELLIAASKNDRNACRSLSIQLGYLTGRESNEMLKAHVDSVMTLAEPFVGTAPEVYDFEDQTITDRVRANIGLMLRERLAPPPEETYSLHRKLSGAFLLCARLRSKVPAREMFAKAAEVWRGREEKVKL